MEMQHKLSETPKLNVAAGRTTCSIFKIPQTLIDINGKSYEPHIVSVGPFHHGQPHLEMVEEHKWRLLRQLLNRTQTKGMVLEDFLRAVQPLEATARESYSVTIPYNTDEFIEMMVLDGCFIIELFRMLGGLVEVDEYDPLVSMTWIVPFFFRDLIRSENQIPFFVLECLFELTKTPKSPTLATLALGFFNRTLQRPDNVLEKCSNVKAKHLLDLLRSSFIPLELEHCTEPGNLPPPHIIHNISKLKRSGIKLKPWEAESFLMVKFKNGVIHMPTITIDDFMCTGCSKIFTTYVTLLDSLVNTSKDVGLLCDQNIIENYLGTDAEVATFFNNMGKDISFDIDECYLARLFDDVNRHYHSGWHTQWAGLKYTYFSTPWSFVSVMAASVLLVFTVVQTIYTILGYTRPR
ncbi:hypothetical protein HanHA300_Chr11g0423711 [Helianthus annuus]|nr:hypothetical protein HanHA300_Chr11g0423711 [Helianthus annuus]KAJ0511720.1 hypothetical protein HanIR_Chr11g0555241 [Helianthus annuus]KAJ0691150.1 hypothetical protein HanOQP8_Chr11g0425861 [Helianthus annuus]